MQALIDSSFWGTYGKAIQCSKDIRNSAFITVSEKHVLLRKFASNS